MFTKCYAKNDFILESICLNSKAKKNITFDPDIKICVRHNVKSEN